MAVTDKDILITPNIGEPTNLPEIKFVGTTNVPLSLKVLDNNNIRFEDSTSSSIFTVSQDLSGNVLRIVESSGLPLLNVNTSDGVALTPFYGSTSIGQDFGTYKLDVSGPKNVTDYLGSAAGGSDQKMAMIVRGGSNQAGRYAGIDFQSYYSTAKFSLDNGLDYPHARIAVRSEGSGGFLTLGTSDDYNGGITNKSITIDPSGKIAFTHDTTDSYTFPDPDTAFCFNTSANDAVGRQVTIKSNNQNSIMMGSYPSSWCPALMIQNVDNTGWWWTSAIATGYNARTTIGGKGWDVFVNAPAGSSGTGSQMLAINTETLSSNQNGHLHVYGPIRQKCIYDLGRHIGFFSYNSTANGGYYIHMKTTMPWFNSYIMYAIKAEGYAYGNTQYIDCRWTGYTYASSGLIQASLNNVTSGMSASTQYQSSDGYVVLVGYSSGHYYIGFTLDAYIMNPTPGGHPIKITASTYSSSQTGVY